MNKNEIEDMSNIFYTMGDYTRLKILIILLKNDKTCVGTITKQLEISQSAVSHQLKILKSFRIVSSQREGKHIYYTLNDSHIKDLINICYKHILEER